MTAVSGPVIPDVLRGIQLANRRITILLWRVGPELS
jgi:hypothetical protein